MSFAQGKRLGLVLGGGGARGLAHLGVLQVLEEAGVRIDAVTGASVGAFVGAAVAAGLPIATLSEVARSVRWWHLARPCWPRRGLVSFAPLEAYLKRLLGDINIEDLSLPFACVATDAFTGAGVVFRSGQLAPRVRASCSVPGAVKPILIDGVVYVDGGMVDNLPIDIMHSIADVDVILAVNLFGPPTFLPQGIVGFTLTVAGHTLVQAGCNPHSADILVEPDCTGFSLTGFRYEELVGRGRAAMTAQLQVLLQVLQ
ncbi:MAG: patatin-like phospholipase family protein [Caldilineales bacterium]|nr:patatin-like phospholipase family protein [Caldilineales bacterium]